MQLYSPYAKPKRYLSSINKVFISRKNTLQNYTYLSSLYKNKKIVPVLKSNAYGHGLVEIASILDTVEAPFFCVNSFYEAYTLWKNGIKTSIHIMGYVDPLDLQTEKLPFSYTTYNYTQLEAINRYQKGAQVHIFVDTGMHREGFRLEALPLLLKNIKQFDNIHITGLMSHLAMGDKIDNTLTEKQFNTFKKAQNIVREYGIVPQWEHILNSPGLLNLAQSGKPAIGNIARVGKAIYGIDPRGQNSNLRPILTFRTKVVQVKKLKKGDKVGYDFTYTALRNVTLGILPVGYYDGVDRRLSNKGVMSVNGIYCQIVGRVSMNVMVIDISKIKKPKVGQEVIIISDKHNDINSIENIAALCNTIPYEVMIGLSEALQRIIV